MADLNDFSGAVHHILGLGFSHLKSRPTLNLKGVVVSCKYTDEISEDNNPEKRLDSLRLFSPFDNFVYSHYNLNAQAGIYHVFFYKASELLVSKTELEIYIQSLGFGLVGSSLEDGRTVLLRVTTSNTLLTNQVKRYKDMTPSKITSLPENIYEITYHYFDE